MPNTKLLLVEDDANYRFYFRKLLLAEGYNVDIISNGKDALKLIADTQYDIIITDWLMPEMDGIDLTKRIRMDFNIQPIIIVLTAVNSEDARKRAMYAGADEYVTKPVNKDVLFSLIETTLKRKTTATTVSNIAKFPTKSSAPFYGIGVVASTGGPFTLSTLFNKLDSSQNAAYFVVQHGQEWMLSTFVKSLREKTTLPVHLAASGMNFKPKNVYLAPGDRHLVINKDSMTFELLDTEPINYVKPSADPLFKSIAEKFGNKSIGVVLTGMGKDGTLGAGYIKAGGGKIVVQDPASAILRSMPESVIELNLANRICNINLMPSVLKSYMS